MGLKDVIDLASIAEDEGGIESIHEQISSLRRLDYPDEAKLLIEELRQLGLPLPPGEK